LSWFKTDQRKIVHHILKTYKAWFLL